MAGWYDDEVGADRLEGGDRGAGKGNGDPGWLALPEAMDWGFPATPEKPKREKSMSELLYPGYDKPEPAPQPKAPAWGAPKREKSLAELLYPRHFPQDDQEQGWPAPDVLHPSHKRTPSIPEGAVLNASDQGADEVVGGGDDALDAAPASSGGGFWDRLGAWMALGEAEAKGRQPANNNPYPVTVSKEQQIDHLTRVLVKETGGMRDNPLDRESFEDLQNARKHMAVVAMRNRDVGLFQGDWPAQDKKVWDACRAAAEAGWEAAQGVPKDVQNFYMVQRGKETRQPPRWGNDDSLYYEFGPFRSYGGAIADGENAYIRIHGKKQR